MMNGNGLSVVMIAVTLIVIQLILNTKFQSHNEQTNTPPKQQDQNSNAGNSIESPEHVSLNLGGTLFHTTRSTLLKIPTKFFPELLKSKPSPYGWYFIDRSRESFEIILDYLRFGTIHESIIESLALRNVVASDFNYYGFQALPHKDDTISLGPIIKKTDLNEKEFKNFLDFKSNFKDCRILRVGNEFLAVLTPNNGIKIYNHKGEVKYILAGSSKDIQFINYTNGQFIGVEKGLIVVWKIKSDGKGVHQVKNRISAPGILDPYSYDLQSRVLITHHGYVVYCNQNSVVTIADKNGRTTDIKTIIYQPGLFQFADGTFVVFSRFTSHPSSNNPIKLYFDNDGRKMNVEEQVKNQERIANSEFLTEYEGHPKEAVFIDNQGKKYQAIGIYCLWNRECTEKAVALEGGKFVSFLNNQIFIFDGKGYYKVIITASPIIHLVSLKDGSIATVHRLDEIKVHDLNGWCTSTLVSLTSQFTVDDLLFYKLFKNTKLAEFQS